MVNHRGTRSQGLLCNTREALLHRLAVFLVGMFSETGWVNISIDDDITNGESNTHAGARVVINWRGHCEGAAIDEILSGTLTNGCLQSLHTIDLAASFTLAWLFVPLEALSALRSRFCCALAPYERRGSERMKRANVNVRFPSQEGFERRTSKEKLG